MSERGRETRARVIVTALAEQADRLLLAQLAAGRFAGFWLLPSAMLAAEPLEATVRAMLPERTGYPAMEPALSSVLEEAKAGVPVLRFVFRCGVGEPRGEIADPEIRAVRWFTRTDARELLAEREAVPTLGVMAALRAWADGVAFRPLESLTADALCPCGSGFSYKGCCGWDAE